MNTWKGSCRWEWANVIAPISGNVYFSPFLNCTTNNSMDKHTVVCSFACSQNSDVMRWSSCSRVSAVLRIFGEREEDVLTVDSSTMAMSCMNHHLHSAALLGAARIDNGNFFVMEMALLTTDGWMMERREKSREPFTTLEAVAAPLLCVDYKNGWEREEELRETLDRHYWKRSFN